MSLTKCQVPGRAITLRPFLPSSNRALVLVLRPLCKSYSPIVTVIKQSFDTVKVLLRSDFKATWSMIIEIQHMAHSINLKLKSISHRQSETVDYLLQTKHGDGKSRRKEKMGDKVDEIILKRLEGGAAPLQ